MNSLLASLANKLFDLLWPKIIGSINENLDEWLPKIIQAVVIALSQAAGQLTVNAADRITEIIPGEVDDFVVDAIVQRARDALADFGIRI